MATTTYNEDTFPWDEYDKLNISESEAFLQEHPEGRQLLYSRDMMRMAKRRVGEAPLLSGHTGPENPD